MTARIPEAYQWLLVPTQSTPQSPVEWQSFRLTGQDALAVRASKKLKNDELLVTSLGSARLRMDLDKVPLWRGDHVAIRQLVEDFGRYLYLSRIRDPEVLLGAIRGGFSLLTWEKDSFAYAESYDEGAGRYRGLRGGQQVLVADADAPGLLVKSEIARKQLDAETRPEPTPTGGPEQPPPEPRPDQPTTPEAAKPKRFHGTVELDPDPSWPRRRSNRRRSNLTSLGPRRCKRKGDARNRGRDSQRRTRQRRADSYGKQPDTEVQESGV